jgi:hypothetical protein
LLVFFNLILMYTIFICLAYHAPIDIYTQLSNEHLTLPESNVINVCVGKEWYRYPSSFFLPDDRYKKKSFLILLINILFVFTFSYLYICLMIIIILILIFYYFYSYIDGKCIL